MLHRGALRFSLLVTAFLAGLGCGDPAAVDPELPAATVYEVRGVVRQVRQQGTEGKTQLSILHEAIPDFVGIDGEVVGMKSMTMPFAVAEDVDLTTIEPGSRVRFELSVDWNRGDPGLITSIEVLPEDVLLEFETSD